jgi:hypothetical protein
MSRRCCTDVAKARPSPSDPRYATRPFVQALVLLLCLETNYSPDVLRIFEISAPLQTPGADDYRGQLGLSVSGVGVPMPTGKWRMMGYLSASIASGRLGGYRGGGLDASLLVGRVSLHLTWHQTACRQDRGNGDDLTYPGGLAASPSPSSTRDPVGYTHAFSLLDCLPFSLLLLLAF